MKKDTEEDYREIIDLFDKQLQFAQNIQNKIIPKPNEFVSDYYHFYAMLKPFRKIGGDFYDFHSLRNDQISFILADATGHGIDAAMITSMVKLIYSYAMDNDEICTSPSQLMARIESDIEKQLTSTFFSALTLVLDPNSNTLRYSNAGHPSGILISKDITLMKPSLPLLGLHQMMSHIVYEDIVLPFNRGDKLLFFTDGLVDAKNDNGEFFPMEMVLDIVEKNQTLAINNLCALILKTFNDLKKDCEPTDDVCLIGIEYDY